MESAAEYRHLVENLVKKGFLKTPHIIESFLSADRKFFTGAGFMKVAYEDLPFPILGGQAISQPTVIAIMLEFLSVGKGDRVLEIGTGSGWQTAILGSMIGDGEVVSVERVAEVYNFAKSNIESSGLSTLPIKLVRGDASKLSDGLYDKIISGASALAVPDSWKRLLKVGGRMVIPVGDCLVVADKLSVDDYEVRRYFGFNFVPLVKGTRRISV